ncbi:MAG: DGQHR domain-containing protein [Candidatus Uhrbacteria bacterium]
MITRQYFGCKIAQRGRGTAVEFIVFVAYAKDVAQWTGVRRVGEHSKGTQRILKTARAKAIQRFFSSDSSNIIPGSILIAFDESAATFTSLQKKMEDCISDFDICNNVEDKVEWGTLQFSFDEDLPEYLRPAFIVDGQHRLKGMADLPHINLPIMVAALLNASHEEQAFQFVVINNKSAKVPTDNVKAIISQIDENKLRDRLLNAGVDYGDMPAILKDVDSQDESPFKGLLDWPLNPDPNRRVKLNTIEACLDYIGSKLPVFEDDEDTKKEVFYTIWRAIANHFNILWLSDDKFMTKVSINALNEFVVDGITYAWMGNIVDVFDADSVEAQTRNILRMVPDEFWTRKWSESVRIQDNSVIRGLIKDELGMVSQNARMGRKNAFEKSRLIVDGDEVAEGLVKA